MDASRAGCWGRRGEDAAARPLRRAGAGAGRARGPRASEPPFSSRCQGDGPGAPGVSLPSRPAGDCGCHWSAEEAGPEITGIRYRNCRGVTAFLAFYSSYFLLPTPSTPPRPQGSWDANSSLPSTVPYLLLCTRLLCRLLFRYLLATRLSRWAGGRIFVWKLLKSTSSEGCGCVGLRDSCPAQGVSWLFGHL